MKARVAETSPVMRAKATLASTPSCAAELVVLAPAAPALEAELDLETDVCGEVDEGIEEESEVEEDVMDDDEEGKDVVAKLRDVDGDATAQNWFASDSAEERLAGQLFAMQDSSEFANAVEFATEQKQATSTTLSQPACATASSRQSSIQDG